MNGVAGGWPRLQPVGRFGAPRLPGSCSLHCQQRAAVQQLTVHRQHRRSREACSLVTKATSKEKHHPPGEGLPAVQPADEVAGPEEKGEAVALWVGAAVLFGLGIWVVQGGPQAEQFFAGYLVEQSLSVDNLFVFILVFRYFKTPKLAQDKALTWGILTAAVLRAVIILLGVELIDNFQPVLLGFAAILIYSSVKILVSGDEDDEDDLSDNNIVAFCRRFITVTEQYDGEKFFTLENGARVATPLLLVLAVIELSDIVFAVDSIPAVFGVTQDPFIVYTSNIFAILSLRALYGFVNTILGELRFLGPAVALVLGFIGSKMIADYFGYELSTELSLGVVATLLGGGVAASLLLPEPSKTK
ncbi:hypothetical protein WJX84_000815 [Apatococcus fuscideae]|uniref:Integral membrane protein TerC n=1 Tax=Apatococcus fuscideae TaxID=2026836 RepID=A0AAW1SVZ4_9CHLO